MDPKDQEKIAFRSDRGLYCYNVMPFGLKNAGSTYQRLVNRMFKEEIWRTMEVYIDDMSQKFEWTQEHKKAFGELKQYLSTPPLLSKPKQGEPLYLYLSVTEAAVSAVLVREHEVVTNYPQRTIMRKPELSGRMVKWSVHLSGYDLKFEPRTTIKSQALANFVSDFSPTLQEQADNEILTLSEAKGEQVWELNVDGASNTKGGGVGMVLKSPQGGQIIQAVRCEFKATNNEAEYEALILGLQLALEMQINHIKVCSDSQLIVSHVNNVYTAMDPKMVAYLEVAKELKLRLASFHIQQIPRDQNVEADALAALGAAFTPGAVGSIPFIHVMKPAIRQHEQQNASKAVTTQWTYEAGILCTATPQEETDDWRKPYISWLRDEVLPPDQKDARRFKMKSSKFVLIDGILFRKSLA
ncbi:uncharacterized protein LOC141651670 [Silene latifolia]|uniref:uncharacterized protein LOC141651670 n=1 Tax=Silene latifolia TaxID=37657 RepID=UPI003D78AAFA